jgi:hypothetical protein
LQSSGKSGRTARRKESLAIPNLKTTQFVCAASFLLALWLGLTFVNKVPANRYPSLGKGSVSTTSSEALEKISAVVGETPKRLATVPSAH